MASPFTAYCAGMGTAAAALALGFSTAVMLTTGPSVSQREQPSNLQKRTETEPPRAVNPAVAASPVITAAQTPIISTTFAMPPPLWLPSARSTTGQSSREPELAPDPGVRQIPVRPALPAEAAAAAPPGANAREAAHDAAEPKKKKKSAQRKPRHQTVEQEDAVAEARAARGYAPEPRSPLGIFGLFLGDNSRAR